MDGTEEFERSVLVERDRLFRYAHKLTKHRERAEDCVQETLMRALRSRSSFTPGTNMRAWLVTILRNYVYVVYRKSRREVEDVDGNYAGKLSVVAREGGDEESRERAAAALAALPEEQRQVIQLMMDGRSYEEIAQELDVPVGTVKSRMSRGRMTLVTLLDGGRTVEKEEYGVVPDKRAGTIEIRRDPSLPVVRRFEASNFPEVSPATDPGERPEQSWLSISSLCIDERYQRSILRVGYKNIIHIAQNFVWRKFTPVIVARWEGELYVVDGQHRTYGALLAGQKSVPCMIFDGSPSVAADAFAAINRNVTQISPLQVFGAKLTAGDPKACMIDRICRTVEVEIRHYPVPLMKMKPGQTIALKAIEMGLRRVGEPGLQLALRMLMTAHPGERGILCAALIKTACSVVEALDEERPEKLLRAVRGVSFTKLWREVGVKGDLAGAVVRSIRERMGDDT